MYTGGKVRRFIGTVAACVVLFLGALPATRLACEWTCASNRTETGHRDGHMHHDSSQAAHAAHSPSAGPLVRPSESRCAHDADLAPALTSVTVKVFAPLAVVTRAFECVDFERTDAPPAVQVTGSPPGARPRPLSLRI